MSLLLFPETSKTKNYGVKGKDNLCTILATAVIKNKTLVKTPPSSLPNKKLYLPLLPVIEITAQKMKYSIKEFFSKCDQICRGVLKIFANFIGKYLCCSLIFKSNQTDTISQGIIFSMVKLEYSFNTASSIIVIISF